MKTDEYHNINSMVTIEQIFNVKGKIIVILGGCGKMGQQFALTLSYAGAHVVIADLYKDRCFDIASKLRYESGNQVWAYQCDVTNSEDIKNLFKFVFEKFSRIDSLIYNVMAKPDDYYKPFHAYPLQTWKDVINGNLTGAFECCQVVSDYMKEQRSGSIILTSSIYGVVGPDQRIYKDSTASNNIYNDEDGLSCPVSYSASKAGLIGMAKYLATLLGEYNIRINVLTPGGVFDGQEESFHTNYVNRTPLNRMAVWSDFNGAILFLTSDASRYMTGTNLVIDGGWTAW